MLEYGSRHTGQKFLLFGSKPKASTEPPRVPCPAGPDFGDHPLLSPERDPDAAGNPDRLLAILLAIPKGYIWYKPGLLIVFDYAPSPLRQLFLLPGGQVVIASVPWSTLELDVGEHSLLTINTSSQGGPAGA